MKFCVVTLGCFKNTVDSELLITEMEKRHVYLNSAEDADIIIVNTCAFIEHAKEESINTILSLAGTGMKVIVVGCLGQLYSREILDEIPGVYGVAGVYPYRDIVDLVEQVREGKRTVRVRGVPDPGDDRYIRKRLLTPAHSAFVKISDGCNRQCSFCTIPLIKGKLRSRPVTDIEAEVEALARAGVKEVNLISQDTTSYGIDLHGKSMLVGLLSRIVGTPGIEWIRLLYNYPGTVDEDLLAFISGHEKVCSYLDVPIQHISERILRAMKREVSSERIRRFLARMRERYPDIRLRTTLLVGFPGETEAEFEELCALVREVEFDRLGVFAYSREERTVSYEMEGQVPEEEKQVRARSIMEMQASISLRKNMQCIGKSIPVLVDEQVQECIWDGRTEYDAPEIDNGVLIEGEGRLRGEIIPVEITDATEYDLYGRLLKERSDTWST
jgi:ribosomal protein S12 methylthiotransferase